MEKVKKCLLLLVGLFIYAAAFNMFIKDNNFVIGGVTGILLIIQDIFSLEGNRVLLLISGSCLLLGFAFLEKSKLLKAFAGGLLMPFFVQYTSFMKDLVSTDRMIIAALAAAILSGIGLGIVHKAGFSAGGTDIITQILSDKFKMPLGKTMFLVEGVVILIGLVTFGLNIFFYDILILMITTITIDRISLGISSYKCFFIASEREDEIKDMIPKELGVTTTILTSKNKFNLLMCIVPNDKYIKFIHLIKGKDNDTFYIATDLYQAMGGKLK